MAEQSEIRYLNAPTIDTKRKKYCRFKKSGIFQEERYQVHRLQGSRVPEEVPQRAG